MFESYVSLHLPILVSNNSIIMLAALFSPKLCPVILLCLYNKLRPTVSTNGTAGASGS